MVPSTLAEHDVSHELLENPGYRPLSAVALAGLIVSFTSVLAFWNVFLLAFAVLAGAVNLRSLVRLKTIGRPMAGRTLSCLGLAISLLCGCVAGAMHAGQRTVLLAEADLFANSWFGFLRRGEPHKAIMLTRTSGTREPLDDDLWVFFRRDNSIQSGLRDYVRRKDVASLLALGDKATVRLYQVESVLREGAEHVVTLLYAVTFDDDDGARRSLFVRLKLARSYVLLHESYSWQVSESTLLSSPPPAFGAAS